MTKGRLTNPSRIRRDDVERVLFELAPILAELDEVELRTRQAMRRTPLVVDVLQPALSSLEHIRERVSISTMAIGKLWMEGSERKWKDE